MNFILRMCTIRNINVYSELSDLVSLSLSFLFNKIIHLKLLFLNLFDHFFILLKAVGDL